MHKDQSSLNEPAQAASIDKFLAVIARKKVAHAFPECAGMSYVYDVATGWEAQMLRQDPNIRIVNNGAALEGALQNPGIEMIFVPDNASVTRSAVLRIGRRHSQRKTIFYEVGNHE